MIRGAAFFAALAAGGGALAEPKGAPWSHDGGPGRADCSACHFDADAIEQSAAVRLAGLPYQVEPGAAYGLEVLFDIGEAPAAGFLLRADAGAFSTDDPRLEAKGAAVRTVSDAVERGENGEAVWRLKWTAPAAIAGDIHFYLAANAANDDSSPFGDRVYVSAFTLAFD